VSSLYPLRFLVHLGYPDKRCRSAALVSGWGSPYLTLWGASPALAPLGIGTARRDSLAIWLGNSLTEVFDIEQIGHRRRCFAIVPRSLVRSDSTCASLGLEESQKSYDDRCTMLRGGWVVDSAAKEEEVVGGVVGIGAISWYESEPLRGDLFHSNRAPENMGPVREKTPLSSFSKWNDLGH
jgi:hypothetical protein